MQNIGWGQPDGFVFACRLIPGGLVLVIQSLSVQVSAYAHAVWLQRIEPYDFT